MALLINRNTNILGNLVIPEIYVRLYIVLHFDGKTLEINTVSYSSKDTYLSGGINNGFKVSGIPDYLKFQYDRSTDGIDLLTVAHDKLKTYLSNDMIYNEAVLDPSTNKYQFDGEGNLITREVTINKFAQDSSISFLIDSSII
jgi:hypothetical protein